MNKNGYSLVEFESNGKTYRIREEGTGGKVAFNPYYFVNQMRDSVGQYTDLLTNQIITVNWQQIGVIRVLETHASTPEAETIDEGLSILEEAELAVMPENKKKKIIKQSTSYINHNQEAEFSEEPLDFCFYCGADLNGNQTACPSCGGKLK